MYHGRRIKWPHILFSFTIFSMSPHARKEMNWPSYSATVITEDFSVRN